MPVDVDVDVLVLVEVEVLVEVFEAVEVACDPLSSEPLHPARPITRAIEATAATGIVRFTLSSPNHGPRHAAGHECMLSAMAINHG